MIKEIKSGQAERKSRVSIIQSELEDVKHKTQNSSKELIYKTEENRWN
jgi:hypothetical protein